MQDFYTLRNRAEGSVQRLTAAVDMLRQLEEKHAAHEQELAYYRQKMTPLEKTNMQLTTLMETLLDLIDNGLSEGSTDQLQEVASKATSMLADDSVSNQAGFAQEPTAFGQPTPVDAGITVS